MGFGCCLTHRRFSDFSRKIVSFGSSLCLCNFKCFLSPLFMCMKIWMDFCEYYEIVKALGKR